MSFTRSEDVDLYQITFSKDGAWDLMNSAGSTEAMQFINLNTSEQPFNLPYANQVKTCNEAIRQLEFLEEECHKFKVPIRQPKSIAGFLKGVNRLTKSREVAESVILEKMQEDIREKNQFMRTQITTLTTMQNDINSLIEQRNVMQMSMQILGDQDSQNREENEKTEPAQVQMAEMQNLNASQDEEALLQDNHRQPTARQTQQVQPLLDQEIMATATVQSSLVYIAGLIRQEDQFKLERILFRITRSKALCFAESLPEEFAKSNYAGQKDKSKCVVFLTIFEDINTMRTKLSKVCESYMNKVYEIPNNSKPREHIKHLSELEKHILLNKDLVCKTRITLRNWLIGIQTISADSESMTEPVDLLAVYKLFLLRERRIYVNLNKFKIEDGLFFGFCWIPSRQFADVENTFIEQNRNNKNVEKPRLFLVKDDVKVMPPTLIRTNDFTYPYQMITDTYGVPRYQEFNPSVFSTVTFPFLFGVMFGDIGHGAILLSIGIFLCIFEPKLKKREGLELVLQFRYMVLLMGFFATYCGFMYNDFMSIPLTTHTCYEQEVLPNGKETNNAIQIPGCVHMVGLDPVWYLSTQEIAFMNSMKMKIAVIIGVLHMTLGVFVKGANAVFFKSKVDFFFEFLPQLMLLLALFGYMDLMIIAKWCTDFSGKESESPSIIANMISMALNGGVVTPGTQSLIGSPSTQQTISVVLILVVIACVPAMLFPKPIYLYRKAQKHLKEEEFKNIIPLQDHPISNDDAEDKQGLLRNTSSAEDKEKYLAQVEYRQDEQQKDWRATNKSINDIQRSFYPKLLNEFNKSCGNAAGGDHGSGSIEELFIHQMIETIEFVLGTISNTASYLRLWALSLAHSQLSAVFFENCMGSALNAEGLATEVIMSFIGYLIWATVTLAVLLMMDVLECFLHTLRLHWVEFQNKFYKGDGYKFDAFSFQSILTSKRGGLGDQ